MTATQHWPHVECRHPVHVCFVASGIACIKCGEPAGSPWNSYLCPACHYAEFQKYLALSIEQIARESSWDGGYGNVY